MHFCIVLAEIEPFNNKCEPFSNISSHCSVRAAGNTAFRIGKYGRSYLPAWAVADAFKGSENAMNHVGVRPPVCACVDVFGQATPAPTSELAKAFIKIILIRLAFFVKSI